MTRKIFPQISRCSVCRERIVYARITRESPRAWFHLKDHSIICINGIPIDPFVGELEYVGKHRD
jgi:hypothetical protein